MSIGGRGGSPVQDLRSVYQLKSRVWTKLPDMAQARNAHSCVVSGEDVYVIGGAPSYENGRQIDNVEILNMSTLQWRAGPKLPRWLITGQAIVHKSTIYVVYQGGRVLKLNTAGRWEDVTNIGDIGHWEVNPAPVVSAGIMGC